MTVLPNPDVPLRFRKMRIAVSAVCFVSCLFIIVHWVRGYWWFDVANFRPSGNILLSAFSQEGAVRFVNESPAVIFFGDPPKLGLTFRTDWYEGYRSNFQDAQDASALSNVFRWFGRPNTTRVWQVPHWFLVLLAGAIGLLPWWRGWNSTFRLRTLFVAVSLLAAGLGLAAIALRGCSSLD